LLLKDRTHIELSYIFEILTITDKKNVIGQSETRRKVGVSVYPEAFSLVEWPELFV